jgi:hypothetical protein
LSASDGIRESSQSWRDLLLDLKRRGLTTAPQIAVADGALGFGNALGEVWSTTREQRCWVHKTVGIMMLIAGVAEIIKCVPSESWIKVLFFAGGSWISVGSGLRSPA